MARSLNERVNEHLQAALSSLERERANLDEQIRSIRSMIGQGAAKVSAAAGSDAAEPVVRKRRRRRRKLSAEARERIAAAQKKRWSEFRKKKKSSDAS